MRDIIAAFTYVALPPRRRHCSPMPQLPLLLLISISTILNLYFLYLKCRFNAICFILPLYAAIFPSRFNHR